jgi:hypothetical protein
VHLRNVGNTSHTHAIQRSKSRLKNNSELPSKPKTSNCHNLLDPCRLNNSWRITYYAVFLYTLMPKYSPRHPHFKHPQSVFFLPYKFHNDGRHFSSKVTARNRPWSSIGLWDVEASRQSAHRWRWGYQPYAPAGRPLPARRFLVLISVRDWVDSRAVVRLEGLGQLENSMTSSAYEPHIFRLVAMCLNQLRYRVPPL